MVGLQEPLPQLVLSGTIISRELIRSRVAQAEDLATLAARIRVDPEGHTTTTIHVNEFARDGVDRDFGRDDSIYYRYYGDPEIGSNPNFAPISESSFVPWRAVRERSARRVEWSPIRAPEFSTCESVSSPGSMPVVTLLHSGQDDDQSLGGDEPLSKSHRAPDYGIVSQRGRSTPKASANPSSCSAISAETGTPACLRSRKWIHSISPGR